MKNKLYLLFIKYIFISHFYRNGIKISIYYFQQGSENKITWLNNNLRNKRLNCNTNQLEDERKRKT